MVTTPASPQAHDEELTFLESALVILQTPFRWLGIWATSRSLKPLLYALPAILSALLFLIVLLLAYLVPKPELAMMYKKLAADAIDEGNSEEGFRWLQRVSQLTPEDGQPMFLLAQSMMKQGDYALGMDLIQRIAPRNGSGYPDAHYWLALQIFDSPDDPAKQQLQELQHHLTEAAKEPRLAGDASAMLGDLAMRSGHPEEAVALYTKARKVDMVWSSKLVPTLLSLGRKKEAIIAAEEAREHFRKVVLDDANNAQARIQWARYAIAIGDYAEAEIALRAGQQLTPGPEIDQALSALFVSRFDNKYQGGVDDQKPDGGEIDFAAGLQYLEEALRLDPNNAAALTRLPFIAQASAELRNDVKTKLEAALQNQQASSIVHFGLGVIESLDGKPDAAKLHFELASAQGLQTAQLMNNLAWSIAYSDTPTLDTALELANKALEMQPNRGEILDTRGHIFAKMGRYKEAIADLELAIPQLARPDRARRLLQECYSNLSSQAAPENTN
jgi:tetratricopeptide (TPR) repeat protein